MWKLGSILYLMDEETRSCSRNQKTQLTFRISVDRHLFLGVARHPHKQTGPTCFKPTQAQNSHILQDCSWPTLYLIFIVFGIVYAKDTSYKPPYTYSQSFQFQQFFERRSKTHSKICIGTAISLTLFYLCNFVQSFFMSCLIMSK